MKLSVLKTGFPHEAGVAVLWILMLPLIGACGGSSDRAKEKSEPAATPAVEAEASSPAVEAPANYEEASVLAAEAGELSEAEVLELEERLKTRPGDLAARTRLLGRYFSSQYLDLDIRGKFVTHVLWVIENAPHSGIAGTPFVWIQPAIDPDGYVKAKELWLRQIKSRAEETQVIWNASEFFWSTDIELAAELAEKGRAAEPGNPGWSEKLGRIYAGMGKYGDGADRVKAADRSYAEYETALAATSDPMKRYFMLASVAKAAFDADEFDAAKAHAEKLLELAGQNQSDWNHGNVVFQGNTVLGRIALKNKDLKEAKRRILLAVEKPKSPNPMMIQLDMTLAKELLERGERATVLEFFKRCGPLWKGGADKLANWSATVRGGSIPDFGPQHMN